MAVLLVTIPLPPAPAGGEYGWAAWSGDGRQLRASGNAVPALLPSGHEVTLGVPAAALSWHQVTLPQGSMSGGVRLRSMLNGLLEDRLLDDPEQLHFALEPGARTGAPVWLAACQRLWLRNAVQAIEATGRRVTRIVPEWTPQPAGAATLVFATGEPDDARLTVCDASGVATLPLDAGSLKLLGALPTDTVVTAEPAVAQLADTLFERPIPIATADERWLQASQSSWDLAQFDLASTGRARAGKKFASITASLLHAPQWRAARWGLALLIAVQLIGVNAWAFRERQAIEAKRNEVRNILTRTFPSVQLVVDAPVQMRREVAALQQATGGLSATDLEPMLALLAGNLPAGKIPTAIDYSGGQLRLRGLGLQAADTQRIAGALATRGYSARSEADLLLIQADAAR